MDCAGNKTGEVIARDDAHASGVWHGAFHCLIVYERDNRGYALFQKRSANKKIAPGKFDVSVGGHYSAGEDARVAGPREIREELGLDVRFEDLAPVGKRVFVYCFSPGIIEHEFQDVFLLPMSARPEELRLQPEEVDAVFELLVEEGLRLFSGRAETVRGRLCGRNIVETYETVSVHDFVPNFDNYYLKLLLLARRYFEGEREMLVV